LGLENSFGHVDIVNTSWRMNDGFCSRRWAIGESCAKISKTSSDDDNLG